METTTYTQPELVDLPAREVLAVDGAGSPDAPGFLAAIGGLFALYGTLGGAGDPPLEGTFAQEGDPMRLDLDDKDGWVWRLALPAPAAATAAAVAAGDPRVALVRQEPQRVARLVHHGPYADEEPSLAALYAFVAAGGLAPAGPHTEVYLTDPATTAPADMRTWLQVPVR
ncbi:hypothetical protein BJF78_14655 [Pseudonocardia sp. CNS-139]|nr:hypothetical protein BJF78_14655 [Pseudonocardia sp. CNS-139]